MVCKPKGVTRQMVALWGLSRVGLGLVAVSMPGVAVRTWVGSGVPAPAAGVLGRALGGRDLGLGGGTVVAAVTGGRMRGWIVASGVADAVDAVVTFIGSSGPSAGGRRRLVVAASVCSALLAAVLAVAVEE